MTVFILSDLISLNYTESLALRILIRSVISVQVKFNGPFTTPTLASIAEDSRLKLWAEDVLQTPNSSHRFRCIFTLRSETSVPFCSLAFKALMHETYLATITRDAYLAVYQPVDFDDLAGDWGRMEAQYVCATPSRAEETGFRVAWHAEKLPCWSAVEAGLDRQSLSLAVAAMDVVKIFRTDKDKRFYLAAELTGARNIIRDIGWANGAMRGYDLVAAASKDGLVRIYEISTPKPGSGNTSTSSALTATPGQHGKASSGAQHQSTVPTILEPSHGNGTSSAPNSPARFGRGGGRGAASAISTGLARAGSAVSGTGQSAGAAASSGGEAVDANPQVGVVKHVIKCVAEVGREHGGVWRLAWSFSGDLLVTSGDDGAVRAWKKSVSGEWLEAAQVEVEGG